MTPNQLYNQTPESVSNEISILTGCYYCHIPELEAQLIELGLSTLESSRIQIKYHKNHCFDGRRVWILASVWLDNKPVMIIQNAGREGDDWVRRIVTDHQLYTDMVEHIQSILPTQDHTKDDVVDPDVDTDDLISFYGYRLDGYLDYW